MQVVDILRIANQEGASDLHIISGAPPMARINGQLIPLTGFATMPADQVSALVNQMLTDEQRSQFEKEWNLDFSVMLDQVRYRVNVFSQRHGLQAALRIIPNKIPTPEELMLPPGVTQLTDLPRGLVLVTGPTGSGKTTTLACLIDIINQKRRANIITIEDPIEFIYTNKKCVISQREVGQHTPNFTSALKYVLRQDPDVVLIGEMRDLETISAALTVAETGHLVFATLHTIDAPQAVDRIIDVFPARQQQQVRTQLAGVLKAVIAQTLLQRKGGPGRVAAREIMLVNAAIANLIRQGKTHEISSSIEMGSTQGMISLDRALGELVRQGMIDPMEAISKSSRIETNTGRPESRARHHLA